MGLGSPRARRIALALRQRLCGQGPLSSGCRLTNSLGRLQRRPLGLAADLGCSRVLALRVPRDGSGEAGGKRKVLRRTLTCGWQPAVPIHSMVGLFEGPCRTSAWRSIGQTQQRRGRRQSLLRRSACSSWHLFPSLTRSPTRASTAQLLHRHQHRHRHRHCDISRRLLLLILQWAWFY